MLINGQYTKAAMNIYLAVLENRNFDIYYRYITDKSFIHMMPERWY